MRRHIRFGVEVESAHFDETRGQWSLQLSDGTNHLADVLVPACGQLSRPAYPRIDGLDDFEGEVLHSALWRPDLDVTGKEVAVVGTGASAIQIVPQLAPAAGRLTLFQREAAHVIRKPDRPYSAAARTAFTSVPGLLTASRWATYWQLETRAIGFTQVPQLMKVVDVSFRRHLRREVRDPDLRDTLTPRTPIGCKRILISNDYYPALVRPNVSVVSEAIRSVARDGLVTADGTHHRADVIVLGTGFTATDLLAPMRILGLGGIDLNDAWRDGAEAHLGITVSGFPNLFLLYGPNTNLGHSSIVFMLEAQIGYVMQAIDRLRAGDLRWLDVRADVQRSSAGAVQDRITRTVWDRGCTSWYRTPSGRNTLNWPGFTFDYWRRTRTLRLDDFTLEPSVSGAAAAVAGAADLRRMPSARLPRPTLPAVVVRATVKGLQRTVFRPDVEWSVQRRRLALVARATAAVETRGTTVTRGEFDGIPVFRIAGHGMHRGAPTVVHLHGGGFCVGSPEQAFGWAARVARDTGGEVILPTYPLAPEHPFPSAPESVDRMWAALVAQTPGPIVLSGDSAGANLALGLAQRLRDSGGLEPAGLLLMSPWLDLAADRETDADLVARDPMLTPGWLAACADAYAGSRTLVDPEISPIHGSLAGLPPLLVQAGTDDVLVPDSRAVVDAVRAAGGQASLHLAEKRWHDHVLQVGLLTTADEAAQAAVQFIVGVSGANSPRTLTAPLPEEA